MDIKVNGRMPSRPPADFYHRVSWDGAGLEIRLDANHCPEFWAKISVHYDLFRFILARIEDGRPKCGCKEPDAEYCLEARGDDRAVIVCDGVRQCGCGCHIEDGDGETAWDRATGDLREVDPEEFRAFLATPAPRPPQAKAEPLSAERRAELDRVLGDL